MTSDAFRWVHNSWTGQERLYRVFWYFTLLPAAVLIFCAASGVAAGQDEDDSVPAPTVLESRVVAHEVEVSDVAPTHALSSEETRATLTAIAAKGQGGDTIRGAQLSLVDDAAHGVLYLDYAQLVRFRDEYADMTRWYERQTPCGATVRCVQGVARCRPSNTIPQAWCPGFFTTPDGERGALIGTPNGTFEFPGVSPAELAALADEALAAHEPPSNRD